jgi:hypothetical protein
MTRVGKIEPRPEGPPFRTVFSGRRADLGIQRTPCRAPAAGVVGQSGSRELGSSPNGPGSACELKTPLLADDNLSYREPKGFQAAPRHGPAWSAGDSAELPADGSGNGPRSAGPSTSGAPRAPTRRPRSVAAGGPRMERQEGQTKVPSVPGWTASSNDCRRRIAAKQRLRSWEVIKFGAGGGQHRDGTSEAPRRRAYRRPVPESASVRHDHGPDCRTSDPRHLLPSSVQTVILTEVWGPR